MSRDPHEETGAGRRQKRSPSPRAQSQETREIHERSQEDHVPSPPRENQMPSQAREDHGGECPASSRKEGPAAPGIRRIARDADAAMTPAPALAATTDRPSRSRAIAQEDSGSSRSASRIARARSTATMNAAAQPAITAAPREARVMDGST